MLRLVGPSFPLADPVVAVDRFSVARGLVEDPCCWLGHTAGVVGVVRLMGFAASYGIAMLADRGWIIPFLGWERSDGERGLVRLVVDDDLGAEEQGWALVEANPWQAAQAVLVAEGTVVVGDRPVEALIVEGWRYGDPGQGVGLVVPFRRVGAQGGFGVYTPRFSGLGEIDGEVDRDVLQGAFLAGVNRHEPGARAWAAQLVDRTR